MSIEEQLQKDFQRKKVKLARIAYATILSACHAAHVFENKQVAKVMEENQKLEFAADPTEHFTPNKIPEEYYKEFAKFKPADPARFKRFDGYAKRRAFAMTYDVEQKHTEAVYRIVSNAYKKGLSEGSPEFLRAVRQEIGEWGDGYSKLVFRNNTNTATSNVRYHRAQQYKGEIWGWRFVSAKIPTTRETHAELDGVILPVDSPFWNENMPPLDHNCLCKVVEVSYFRAEKEGLHHTPDDKLPEKVSGEGWGEPPENPYGEID